MVFWNCENWGSLFGLCRFEMSRPYYVVFDGHEPGVYYNWPDCQEQVHRFRGACYKIYDSYEEGIATFKSRTNSNPPLAHDDDFYLQNQTAAPPSFSFKTIVIVVLLIFVYLLWKKLWAHELIVSVMVRLDLAGIIMVIAPLTATLVWVIYISMWCYSKFRWGRTMKIVNGC